MSLTEQNKHKTDIRFLFRMMNSNGDDRMCCVSYVYPQTIIDDTGTIEKFSILKSINGTPISSVKEATTYLKNACETSKSRFITLCTDKYDDIILDLNQLREQEHVFAKTFPHFPQDTLLLQNHTPARRSSRLKVC